MDYVICCYIDRFKVKYSMDLFNFTPNIDPFNKENTNKFIPLPAHLDQILDNANIETDIAFFSLNPKFKEPRWMFDVTVWLQQVPFWKQYFSEILQMYDIDVTDMIQVIAIFECIIFDHYIEINGNYDIFFNHYIDYLFNTHQVKLYHKYTNWYTYGRFSAFKINKSKTTNIFEAEDLVSNKKYKIFDSAIYNFPFIDNAIILTRIYPFITDTFKLSGAFSLIKTKFISKLGSKSSKKNKDEDDILDAFLLKLFTQTDVVLSYFQKATKTENINNLENLLKLYKRVVETDLTYIDILKYEKIGKFPNDIKNEYCNELKLNIEFSLTQILKNSSRNNSEADEENMQKYLDEYNTSDIFELDNFIKYSETKTNSINNFEHLKGKEIFYYLIQNVDKLNEVFYFLNYQKIQSSLYYLNIVPYEEHKNFIEIFQKIKQKLEKAELSILKLIIHNKLNISSKHLTENRSLNIMFSTMIILLSENCDIVLKYSKLKNSISVNNIEKLLYLLQLGQLSQYTLDNYLTRPNYETFDTNKDFTEEMFYNMIHIMHSSGLLGITRGIYKVTSLGKSYLYSMQYTELFKQTIVQIVYHIFSPEYNKYLNIKNVLIAKAIQDRMYLVINFLYKTGTSSFNELDMFKLIEPKCKKTDIEYIKNSLLYQLVILDLIAPIDTQKSGQYKVTDFGINIFSEIERNINIIKKQLDLLATRKKTI